MYLSNKITMVLLFIDPKDITTNSVLRWIIKQKINHEIININSYDFIDIIHIDSKKISISINNRIIDFFKIKSIYFSRSFIKMYTYSLNQNKEINDEGKRKSIINFLLQNRFTREELILYLIKKKNLKIYGEASVGRINKIIVLNEAKKIGLKIPNTMLTTKKTELITFFNLHENIIIKPYDLSYSFINSEEKIWESTYTNVFPPDYLKKIPNEFPLTLFQEQIQKKFEIRSYIFNKQCYSVAIFSQNNIRTQVDYRHYDKSKPNREIPFTLNPNIKKKF